MNVKISGNATNLRNHLMRKHENLYDVNNVPKKPKKNENSDGDQQVHVYVIIYAFIKIKIVVYYVPVA